MKSVGQLGLSKRFRLGLLLVTFLGVAAALVPAPGLGVLCCGYTTHYIYYNNAAHTSITGSCTYNEACTGAVYCDGTKTGYYTVSSTCCPHCSQ